MTGVHFLDEETALFVVTNTSVSSLGALPTENTKGQDEQQNTVNMLQPFLITALRSTMSPSDTSALA